jgi:hypothetical protein
MVDDLVVGTEHAVRKPVVAHVLPDVFLRVELRAFREDGDDRDVCGQVELRRQVPSCLIVSAAKGYEYTDHYRAPSSWSSKARQSPSLQSWVHNGFKTNLSLRRAIAFRTSQKFQGSVCSNPALERLELRQRRAEYREPAQRNNAIAPPKKLTRSA